MPGGRADYFPIRSWDLACNVLAYGATHIRVLLVIFAVPEIIHTVIYLARNIGISAMWIPWWVLPNWVMVVVGSCISAVVFTGIIRYVVLAEGPFWLPPLRWIRSYLTTAAVLIPVVMIIAYINSVDLLIAFYRTFVAETHYDEGKFLETQSIFYAVSFLLSAVLIAVVYPVIALTATGEPVAIGRMLRWNRRYFWRFLSLTLLLMSACLITERGYWWLLGALTNKLNSIGYAADASLNVLISQLTILPLYFLFDIIPAVAIGLLYRVLRANSADL